MPKNQTKKQDQAAEMPLSQIIKELNAENAPPDGWKPEDKVTSSQAGGPSQKKNKAASLTGYKQ